MTHLETILGLLQERGSAGVSAAEVIYQHGITRVAARINDLRNDGWNIETHNKPGKTATYVLVSPLKPSAPPPTRAPRCPTAGCGMELSDVHPTVSPQYVLGRCPIHRAQMVAA